MNEYENFRRNTIKWLNRKGRVEVDLFLDMLRWMKDEYIEVQTRIEIAFKILNDNIIWEDEGLEKFIQENDALFATQELIYNLDIYDLPRVYIMLQPIELFEKALDFLLDKLEELDLIDEYYEITEEE